MRVLSRCFWRSLLAAMLLTVFCAGAALADYAYYFPCFSNSASKGEMIGLALANTTASVAKIKIAIIDREGVTQGVESWELPAYGQRADVIGAGLDGVEGSFQVLSDQPLTGLAFLFAQQMQVMYDLPMTQTPATKLDIPQAAQDNDWGMQISINNPGESEVTAAITYRSADGSSPTSAYAVKLKPYGSAVIDLADLLAGWGLTELDGGCLHLAATGAGIVAFATYDTFRSGGKFYAGLAAVDPSIQKDNYDPVTPSQYAVVSCPAPDYASGTHALVEVEKPRTIQDNLLPTISDIKMAAHGAFFYRIERYNGDNITKFAAAAPATPIWQYSTMDANDVGATCNPQSMAFASDTKAYVPRFDSTRMWIVNPSTTTDAGFKIGEVDLSAYADADGKPEMTKGVVVDGKLFLLLQRLDKEDNWTPQTPYLVVIDTATNEEIETQNPAGDLKGIPLLPIKNPWDIVYKNGKIYINGAGSYPGWDGTPADYSGGIVSVDPSTYEVKMIVDDGDETAHPYGNISGMTVVSATKGYFISYAGRGDNSLYSFNPTTGAVSSGPIAAFSGGDNISALGVDASGMLWVASNTAAGGGVLTIINPADDSVDQVLRFNLNPQGMAFGTWE